MSIDVRIKRISWEAPGIHSYELVPVTPGSLPAFTAGAHIDVQLPGGYRRQYSLYNSPSERHRYLISVLELPMGRGGSRALHNQARPGDVLSISGPYNHFELVEGAPRYILIAGGIGVTPLLSMMARLTELKADHVLHYCCRRRDIAAFSDVLAPLTTSGHVVFHEDGGVPANGLDVQRLLENDHTEGAQIYCCGPVGLMQAVLNATRHADSGWPVGAVHFESFRESGSPPTPPVSEVDAAGAVDQDFEIELASTGQIIPVPHHRSILETLRTHGIDVESSCEAGTCGACVVRYLSGEPDHQDYVLSNQEQREYMMACVSRAKSMRIKLDL